MKEYLKKYYIRNKEKIKERGKVLRTQPEVKQRIKEYYNNNKERLKESSKEYYSENRERLIAYVKQPHVRKRCNQNIVNRRKTDPFFRISRNMQNRIWFALKNAIAPKSNTFKKGIRTIELLGCTEFELLGYLRAKYQPGMTDQNYGEWHVDHIKPVSSFDLTKPGQVKECFHFTNLQPLWAVDNLKKSDKIS